MPELRFQVYETDDLTALCSFLNDPARKGYRVHTLNATPLPRWEVDRYEGALVWYTVLLEASDA